MLKYLRKKVMIMRRHTSAQEMSFQKLTMWSFSSNIGRVPPIVVEEEFLYHYQLMLAGMHNHNIQGICYNLLNKSPQQLLLNIAGIILMSRVLGMI